jgi:predicted dehydrogenase
MLRIAVSGAGAIASRAHLPALIATQGAQVVAIQSRTADKARAVAESLWPDAKLRPAFYADFDEMLSRERPDAVCIFTPNHLHLPYALKAISAGAHVMVEKPMARSAPEARAMVEACRKAGRVLVVSMQRRYGGIESAIKRAIDTGAIGRPTFIRARLSHGGPHLWAPGQDWFTDPAQAGGGAMLDLGVHVADLALWYMGQASSVSALTATLAKDIRTDDTGAMLVKFRSGAIGVVEASWSASPALSAIEIYGTEGRILTGYPRVDIAIQRADGTEAPGYSRAEVMAGFDASDLLAPFRAIAHNFVAAVAGLAAASPSGEDGLRAIELIDAAYRSSAADGAPIVVAGA